MLGIINRNFIPIKGSFSFTIWGSN